MTRIFHQRKGEAFDSDIIQLLRLNNREASPVTKCTQVGIEFPGIKRRRVEAEFTGGEITSDGGVLLLREVDRQLKLTESVAGVLSDSRRRGSCTHDLASLVRQRVYGLALGYEDLNDHRGLRTDAAL
ncbi:MAG: hypothetical protein DWQ08_12040 [Proteobacteria bacterium]|nr:MAG: hypothetical protein DWQ08_12040 [Pseudomonadota bacterium]